MALDVAFLDHGRRDEGEIHHATVGLHGAPRHPVQIEEVGQKAAQLARIGGHPPDEVLLVLRSDGVPALLQGEGASQDARERRAEVVGDGLEERVLHLVKRREPLRRLLLRLQGLSQDPFSFLLLGDVVHDPLEVGGPALVVHQGFRLLPDPDDALLRAADAVLTLHPRLTAQDLELGRKRLLPVLGKDLLTPELRRAHELLLGEAQDGLDLRAHVPPCSFFAELRDVDDGRQALDQRPVLRLRISELLLGPTVLRDVDHQALQAGDHQDEEQRRAACKHRHVHLFASERLEELDRGRHERRSSQDEETRAGTPHLPLGRGFLQLSHRRMERRRSPQQIEQRPSAFQEPGRVVVDDPVDGDPAVDAVRHEQGDDGQGHQVERRRSGPDADGQPDGRRQDHQVHQGVRDRDELGRQVQVAVVGDRGHQEHPGDHPDADGHDQRVDGAGPVSARTPPIDHDEQPRDQAGVHREVEEVPERWEGER